MPWSLRLARHKKSGSKEQTKIFSAKFRASDGKALGTFTVGNYPVGVDFDGANIWVSAGGTNVVAKL